MTDFKQQLQIQAMYDNQIKAKKTDVQLKDEQIDKAKRRLKANKRANEDVQGNRF